ALARRGAVARLRVVRERDGRVRRDLGALARCGDDRSRADEARAVVDREDRGIDRDGAALRAGLRAGAERAGERRLGLRPELGAAGRWARPAESASPRPPFPTASPPVASVRLPDSSTSSDFA